MDNGFIDLGDIAALDQFLTQSVAAPVVIFKHSETCGVSARAYSEMLKLAAQVASLSSERGNVSIGIVAIQTARNVSDEIEVRTGVEHESPQVFVMMNGQVVWSASHGAIRVEAVEQALLQAAGEQ